MHILVVEDERKIRELLTAYFEKEGWQVTGTGDGTEALALFRMRSFDLVVLDLMLEGLQGEEICRAIRQISTVPILMLTAKTRESDAIEGLNLGADHYFTKPFRIKEIVAQIQAMIRRMHAVASVPPPLRAVTFNRRKLVMTPGVQDVTVDGIPALLTTTEFRVLSVLIEQAGRIVSRGDLNYKVLGYRFLEDGRTIDAHIKNIRKKIERDPKNPEYIVTKIGAGYKFVFLPDGDC